MQMGGVYTLRDWGCTPIINAGKILWIPQIFVSMMAKDTNKNNKLPVVIYRQYDWGPAPLDVKAATAIW